MEVFRWLWRLRWNSREKAVDSRNVFLTSDDRRSNSSTLSGKMIRKRPVCSTIPVYPTISMVSSRDSHVSNPLKFMDHFVELVAELEQ